MAVSKPRPEGRGHQDCARDGRVGNTVELTDSMAQLESGLESPQAQKSQVEVKRDEANEGPVENADAGYITGARLHVISISIYIGLFFTLMESSVTSTSILAITDQLGGFDKSSWVFTAYLLTYSGLLIVWAKISDIFGRKPLLISAIALFSTFSGACGASQTLVQLIMFRWLQGIGGCGVYSIGTLIFFELVPPYKWPNYTAISTFVFAIALAIGPLVGGGIVDTTTWRWVFLINCPAGAASVVLLVLCLPRKLHVEPSAQANAACSSSEKITSLRKVDIVGALLLIGACLLLSTALQLAATGDSFGEAPVLPLLVVTPFFWAGFVAWAWYVTTKRVQPEPIFPWRFFKSRQMMAITINTFLTGTLYTVLVVQIPQRFIQVDGLSAFDAGVRLIPFSVLVPGTSAVVAILFKKGVPPFYVQVAGAVLQLVGIVLLAVDTPEIASSSGKQYGYQILTGAGIGCSNVALLIIVPYINERRDLAVGTATVGQFRLLGGVVGISIVNSVFVRWIRQPLLLVLSPLQASTLLQKTETISTFPESTQAAVRLIFAEGYNLQLKILIGFAVAQVLVTAAMWKKKQIELVRKK